MEGCVEGLHLEGSQSLKSWGAQSKEGSKWPPQTLPSFLLPTFCQSFCCLNLDEGQRSHIQLQLVSLLGLWHWGEGGQETWGGKWKISIQSVPLVPWPVLLVLHPGEWPMSLTQETENPTANRPSPEISGQTYSYLKPAPLAPTKGLIIKVEG